MLLFIDTETTGLVNFKLPLLHPEQPRLVQIAALLYELHEDGYSKVASLDAIIRPEGWAIDDNSRATAVHKITQERALAFGEPLHQVIDRLWSLVEQADERLGLGRLIAHNISFDTRMALAEASRCNRDVTLLGLLRPFCTMQALTQRIRLPGRYPGTFKWPNLDEAYKFCFPNDTISTLTRHTAMTDLLACKDIFFHGVAEGWWT